MNDDLSSAYRALQTGGTDRLVIGQMGQSLDGFIATKSGASHYVTGPESLVHLHRLRSLVDAVIVGWRTVEADDPQLTVRHVDGPSPVPVVIDLDGRLGLDRRLFRRGSGVLHVVRRGIQRAPGPEGLTHVRLETPGDDARVDPGWLLDELARNGLRRVLVEGGGTLLSSFLAARALDRLHLVVAPMLIGDGRPGVQPPPAIDLKDALRPPAQVYRLGDDVLFDLNLR